MQQRVGCTDWTTSGRDRHRSTTKGYASPDVADDLALHALLVIEEMRQARGLRPDEVAVCGVDNSTTAFAMALIRLLPDGARYRFVSGRKAGDTGDCHCGCMDCDLCCGCLDEYDVRDVYLWCLLDDDICQGRAARTVARYHPVEVFTINNYLQDSVEWEYDNVEWMDNCTFHWWGASSFAGFSEGRTPEHSHIEGEDLVAMMAKWRKITEDEDE
jgi:hypothetical protein